MELSYVVQRRERIQDQKSGTRQVGRIAVNIVAATIGALQNMADFVVGAIELVAKPLGEWQHPYVRIRYLVVPPPCQVDPDLVGMDRIPSLAGRILGGVLDFRDGAGDPF